MSFEIRQSIYPLFFLLTTNYKYNEQHSQTYCIHCGCVNLVTISDNRYLFYHKKTLSKQKREQLYFKYQTSLKSTFQTLIRNTHYIGHRLISIEEVYR